MTVLDIKRAARRPLYVRLSKSLISLSGLLEMWANADDYLAAEEDLRARLNELSGELFDLGMYIKGRLSDESI